MTSRTVGGRQTTFGYDGLNRLTSVNYPNGNTVTIAYFGNGRTQSVVTPQVSWTYTYDANANLKTEMLTVGGQTYTTTYAYNTNDALSSITYPLTGDVIAYAPDNLGRPTTAGPYVTSVSYYRSGNYQEMKLGNGYSMKQTETVRQWPLSIDAVKTGTTTGFMGRDHFYDGAGNVTGINDQFDPSQILQMTYDRNNQLTSTVGRWGLVNIGYDAVGNITSFLYPTVQNYYNYTNNKLTSIGVQNFSYDAYGNITSDTSHTYQYDDASNMTCGDCASASPITYVYDGNNRRVSRTQGGVTTYYVHVANGDLILEYTPSTHSGREHIYVNGKRIASKKVSM